MKHLSPMSQKRVTPVKADSLLERMQKVAIFSTFATAFGVFGNSVLTWIGILEPEAE